jgi:hypothetical protein
VVSGVGATALTSYSTPTNDPNNPSAARSRFEVSESGRWALSFRRAFFGEYQTRLELAGEYRSGVPYSFTFRDNSGGRSPVFGTVGDNNRYLFFVPDFANDANPNDLQVGVVQFADAAIRDRTKAIVEATGLRRFQGQIAPRNLGTGPSFTKMDLKVAQEIPFFWGKFTATMDIENFLNLINPKWNAFRTFPENVSLVDVSCIASGANTCANYRYSTAALNDAAVTGVFATRASLWSMRLGIRYDF